MNNLKKIFWGRFSLSEEENLVKKMSFLIRTGVPLLEVISIISNQAYSTVKLGILRKIKSDVENGSSLSFSFKKHGKAFSDITSNLIYLGERSGRLADSFEWISTELRKRHLLKQKISGAFAYPIFLTVAALLLVSFLIIYIFPKIIPIFIGLDIELPLTTKALISISDFLRHWWVLIIVLAGIISAVSIFIIKKYKGAREILDTALLLIPFLGEILKNYYIANFCRNLNILIAGGESINDSLRFIGETSRNSLYRKSLENAASVITKGGSLSVYLSKNNLLYGDMLPHMILFGEKSGTLPDTLKYCSGYYEDFLDDKIKKITNSIEPVLMIVLGLAVGIVAISVITPIYEITSNIRK